MSLSPDTVRKDWTTDDGMFTFQYAFEYGASPPASPPASPSAQVSVTIAGNDSSSPPPPPSPPPSPPPASPSLTPHTYHFNQNRRIAIDLQTPGGNPIEGEMHIVTLSLENSADNAGIWCNLHYGFHELRHFEGIMVTFQTSLS